MYVYFYRTSAVPRLLLGDPAQTFQFCECFLNTLYNHGASQKNLFLLMNLGFIRRNMGIHKTISS
jgi:hypothetical protein